FIIIVVLLIFAGIGGILDNAGVQTEREKEAIANKEQEKKEGKQKEEEEKKEEERLANRTIDEVLEEDENDVDKAELEDGVLRLERDVTTFWDETSILKQDVLRMFEVLPKAFED